jgi:hypothetical protein
MSERSSATAAFEGARSRNMTQDDEVVGFPNLPEETPQQRAFKKATRLANLAPGEWKLYVEEDARTVGIPVETLTETVLDILKDREKKAREEKADVRRQEERAEKSRIKEQQQEERERKAAQQRIDKEAERRGKEKAKTFAAIAKLPQSLWEAHLADLAKRLDEDPTVLGEEFKAFSGGGMCLDDLSAPARPAIWDVVPWDEPVDVAALLQELNDQIRKYVVLVKERVIAVVLWVAMSWIHNEVATHSPILDVFSVDESSGKTELMGLLGLVTPKPYLGAEFTAANIYRTVDADGPVLIIDEADDVFQRKPDLKHIVNNSWTRGFKIPRQVRIAGELQTHWFEIFCPKILGRVLLAGKPLPRTTQSRGIPIKIWPKKPDERVDEFMHRDDDTFLTLRRKLLRFANDHAAAIGEANLSDRV